MAALDHVLDLPNDDTELYEQSGGDRSYLLLQRAELTTRLQTPAAPAEAEGENAPITGLRAEPITRTKAILLVNAPQAAPEKPSLHLPVDVDASQVLGMNGLAVLNLLKTNVRDDSTELRKLLYKVAPEVVARTMLLEYSHYVNKKQIAFLAIFNQLLFEAAYLDTEGLPNFMTGLFNTKFEFIQKFLTTVETATLFQHDLPNFWEPLWAQLYGLSHAGMQAPYSQITFGQLIAFIQEGPEAVWNWITESAPAETVCGAGAGRQRGLRWGTVQKKNVSGQVSMNTLRTPAQPTGTNMPTLRTQGMRMGAYDAVNEDAAAAFGAPELVAEPVASPMSRAPGGAPIEGVALGDMTGQPGMVADAAGQTSLPPIFMEEEGRSGSPLARAPGGPDIAGVGLGDIAATSMSATTPSFGAPPAVAEQIAAPMARVPGGPSTAGVVPGELDAEEGADEVPPPTTAPPMMAAEAGRSGAAESRAPGGPDVPGMKLGNSVATDGTTAPGVRRPMPLVANVNENQGAAPGAQRPMPLVANVNENQGAQAAWNARVAEAGNAAVPGAGTGLFVNPANARAAIGVQNGNNAVNEDEIAAIEAAAAQQNANNAAAAAEIDAAVAAAGLDAENATAIPGLSNTQAATLAGPRNNKTNKRRTGPTRITRRKGNRRLNVIPEENAPAAAAPTPLAVSPFAVELANNGGLLNNAASSGPSSVIMNMGVTMPAASHKSIEEATAAVPPPEPTRAPTLPPAGDSTAQQRMLQRVAALRAKKNRANSAPPANNNKGKKNKGKNKRANSVTNRGIALAPLPKPPSGNGIQLPPIASAAGVTRANFLEGQAAADVEMGVPIDTTRGRGSAVLQVRRSGVGAKPPSVPVIQERVWKPVGQTVTRGAVEQPKTGTTGALSRGIGRHQLVGRQVAPVSVPPAATATPVRGRLPTTTGTRRLLQVRPGTATTENNRRAAAGLTRRNNNNGSKSAFGPMPARSEEAVAEPSTPLQEVAAEPEQGPASAEEETWTANNLAESSKGPKAVRIDLNAEPTAAKFKSAEGVVKRTTSDKRVPTASVVRPRGTRTKARRSLKNRRR